MTAFAALAITPELIREHGLTPEEYGNCSVDASPPSRNWASSA